MEETKRVGGPRVVVAGFLIVILITAFVVLRMVQSTSKGPATSPPLAPGDSIR
jgi:hypothetical protein